MPDRAQSLLLCDLIALGYDDRFLVAPEAVAKVALAKVGFTLVSVVYGTDFNGLFGQETVPYGVVAKDGAGKVYVALRGTDDAKEWLEDGFAIPETATIFPPNVRVHKGFTDVYQTLRIGQTGDSMPLAAFLRAKDMSTVTGHSLGGALAYLLGAHLGPSCAYLETFEAPRVGDQAFCQWMDSRCPSHYRDVIVGDVVPHAPPEILGYRHAGVEIDMDPAPLLPLPSGNSLEALAARARALHVLTSVQAILGFT